MRTRGVRCCAPVRPVGRVLVLPVLGPWLAAAALPAFAQPSRVADHVLLATLDGARPSGRGGGKEAGGARGKSSAEASDSEEVGVCDRS